MNRKELIKGYTEFIKQEGICYNILCERCPFYHHNTEDGIDCEEFLDCGYVDTNSKWPQAVEKAKEILFTMLLEEKLNEQQ